MSNQEKPRDFVPEEDKVAITLYFKEAASSTASVIMWTKDQENITQSRLAMVSETDGIFYAWIPNDFDFPRFSEDLVKRQTSDCFFSMSLPTANIFFKAAFVELDTMGLKFKIPSKVYKVQRRKNVRVQIPDDYSLPLELQDPLFPGKTLKKTVLDISAGGISFITSEKDAPVFQVGMLLKGLKFSIRLRLIRVTAEVRHKKELPDRQVKVGLAFKEITPNDVEHIEGYVFEENRKYFAKFL